MRKIIKIFIVVVCAIVLFACNKNVNCDSIKTINENYSFDLDSFKLKDIKLSLIENDKVVKTISLSNEMISSEDNESLKKEGRHVITIKYNDLETTVTIDLWGKNKNQSFTVNFYNNDKLMDTQFVNYGEEATYEGKRPTKASTEDFEYIFEGWSDEVGFIVSDLDVYAVFTEKSLYYKVKFVNLDGSTIVEYDKVKKEKGVKAPEMEEIEGYTFDGWSENYNFVIDDLVCHPIYTPIKYDLKLLPNIECSTCVMPNISTYTIEDEIVLPDPTTEATFLGWYDNKLGYGESIEKINKGTIGDITLYAMLDLDPENHMVTFVDYDGSIISQKEYKTNESVEVPKVKNRLGYNFSKWDKDYSKVNKDITIKAVYTPITYTVTYNVLNDNVTYYGYEKLNEYTIEDNYVLPYLSLKGYAFMGWYTEEEYKNNITTLETGNYNLYAKFERLNEKDDFKLVLTDYEICQGYSTRVFAKLGDKYIPCNDVSFECSPSITVSNTGFVVGNKVGESVIIGTYNGYKSSVVINVTKEKGPIWVGHTGCVGAEVVQNTEKAFIEGAQRGYYALECDLKRSKDGVWFLLHDSTFTTGSTYTPFVQESLDRFNIKSTYSVEDYTWDILKQLDVYKNGNNNVLANLCTLQRYLEICKEYNCKAVIEIKWNNGLNSGDNRYAKPLVEFVQSMGMYENAIFMTSMKPTLEAIRSMYPDANMQLLTGSTNTNQDAIDWCIKYEASLDAQMEGLNEDHVKQIHEHNLYVNAWTIDTQKNADKTFAIGVDMITTDALGH